MNRTVKIERIPKHLLEANQDFLEQCIKNQRIDLFKSLDIKDEQPVLLIFKSTSTLEHQESLSDPLADVELRTAVKAEYPPTRHVVVNQMIRENYKEHKSFWAKFKLLFSKRSVYTKDTKEV